MTTTDQLQAIARAIDALCPFGHSIEVDFRRYTNPIGSVRVAVHGCKSYKEATEVCRLFGVGIREKSTYGPECAGPEGRTVLQGDIAPGIRLQVYSDGLPPSCRIETVKERVAKTQTVEVGEFVEIERTRVVCGNGEPT